MSAVPPPAGFWKRYVAYFIDMVMLSLVVNVLASVAMAVVGAVGADDLRRVADALLASGEPPDMRTLLATLEPWLVASAVLTTALYVGVAGPYFIVTESSAKQGSLGKQLLGLHVTDRDGRRLSRAQAAGRFFAAGLSWLTLNLGHALAAWTRERRALHDFVAGTRVVVADPAHADMPGWGWAIVALNAVVFLGIALVAMVAGILVGLRWMGG